jgi:hypothetical protein
MVAALARAWTNCMHDHAGRRRRFALVRRCRPDNGLGGRTIAGALGAAKFGLKQTEKIIPNLCGYSLRKSRGRKSQFSM